MTNGLEAISMEPVKEKLKNLKERMPNENDLLYGFGEYLADRLDSSLNPAEFNLACEFALEDLKKEGDYGKSGKIDVPSRLTGYPPAMYTLLRVRIPEIAIATCPPEFAEEVRKVHDEVNVKYKKR